jgi:hypothetical protein
MVLRRLMFAKSSLRSMTDIASRKVIVLKGILS